MNLFRKNTTPPAPTSQGPAISLDKVPTGLVSLAKTAAVSLDKQGLTGQRAAVYLVVDRSYSMAAFYRDGAVQHLAEQTLGLSANLDDDGTVPLLMFDSQPYQMVQVSLDHHEGVVAEWHRLSGGEATMKGTAYAPAMNTVIRHYLATNASSPALVVFQTDGDPQDRYETEQTLRDASGLPLFWAFVGYGNQINFLRRLDDLTGRTVDNSSFFHARDPHQTTDAELYDGITHEYAAWLTAARNKGVTL